ncbi:hypothetical protein L226DRAFT_138078 [Lentinus tigrinus ALCF2SS1-7]|uniref:uncharacterized protein n=1 Tax=Lentinus tigrinus ALCF2SS1-7 TaxID=1328758 RepID=UPI0011660D5D|nr:hypothetical protein L226DRAFT_138078 [Lentinus tigrinus ALCF2SS1-7]
MRGGLVHGEWAAARERLQKEAGRESKRKRSPKNCLRRCTRTSSTPENYHAFATTESPGAHLHPAGLRRQSKHLLMSTAPRTYYDICIYFTEYQFCPRPPQRTQNHSSTVISPCCKLCRVFASVFPGYHQLDSLAASVDVSQLRSVGDRILSHHTRRLRLSGAEAAKLKG